jgi:adenylate kinase family enzyme
MLIFLNGISTVGKTTIAKMLERKLEGFYIDQDSFYVLNKPQIEFNYKGTDYKCSNWDSVEAINFDLFTKVIIERLKDQQYVIVAGFALIPEYMQELFDYLSIHPNIHFTSFLLIYCDDEEKTIEYVINARKMCKNIKEKDEWIVNNLVWPFYKENLGKIKYYKICVCKDNGEKQQLSEVFNIVYKLL